MKQMTTGLACEACGRPVRRGHFVVVYEDVGEVHVDCDRPRECPPTATVEYDQGPMPVFKMGGGDALERVPIEESVT